MAGHFTRGRYDKRKLKTQNKTVMKEKFIYKGFLTFVKVYEGYFFLSRPRHSCFEVHSEKKFPSCTGEVPMTSGNQQHMWKFIGRKSQNGIMKLHAMLQVMDTR